jgi:uncharacterized protein (TIGR03067 family)
VKETHVTKWSTLVLAAGLLVAAAPRQGDANKKDLEKLQGTWKAETAQLGGKDAPAALVENLQLVIAKDKLTIKDGKEDESATFKLDAGKKPIAAIDLVTKGGKETVLGIYEIKDDTLKLCWNKFGKDRPTEFVSKADTEIVLFVLKRVNKK